MSSVPEVMPMRPRVSLILPTWRAAEYLPRLLHALRIQTLRPEEVIVIDSSSDDGTAEIARREGCRVEVIPQKQFNHGRTRNHAARLAKGDLLVFMTQDVLPYDEQFVEELVRPIIELGAGAAYARQMHQSWASPLESFLRSFNYPPEAELRTANDVERRGIRAYCFSNAASAVHRDVFNQLGGFPASIILNEDMCLAAKLLRSGGMVAYAAEARVLHSHNYSLGQQFRRYFDIGVSLTQIGELVAGASSTGEGVQFAIRQIKSLAANREGLWIPLSIAESAVKYCAFHLGKHHELLSVSIKQRLSMHPSFWNSAPIMAEEPPRGRAAKAGS